MLDAVRPPRIADAIAGRLEGMILEGVLRPGERLLGERELAERLGVSRPSLREALDMLAGRGLLVTGKSGTRIAQFLSPLMKPLAGMMQDKPRVTADYFEFRRHPGSPCRAACGAKGYRGGPRGHSSVRRADDQCACP